MKIRRNCLKGVMGVTGDDLYSTRKIANRDGFIVLYSAAIFRTGWG